MSESDLQKLRTLLMLAYYYPPQQTSGAARPARFARYLPRFGYECAVISARDRTAARISGLPPHVAIGDGNDHCIPLAFGIARLAERLLREYSERLPWIPSTIGAARAVIESLPVAAIWSTSPPIACHLAAWELKRRFGLPWIADFRDPFADNPFRNTPLHRFYDRRVERAILRRADAVVANTEDVAALWSRRYPAEAHKIHTIWNGFDPEELLASSSRPERKRRVLAHIGDIYGPRHPGRILDSISRLIAKGSLVAADILVRLVGPIDPDSILWQFETCGRLAEAGCLEYNAAVVPRAQALEATCDSDYLLLLDITGAARSRQVPAKLFDYIRAGRPILAETPPDSPTERILARSGCPSVCLYPGDTGEIIDGKIAAFLRVPPASYQPSAWFRTQFDGAEQTRALARILDTLAPAPSLESS